MARTSERAELVGMQAGFVQQWHDHPVLIELLAERVGRALESLGHEGVQARADGELLLLVTAHSLPVRVVADGDPYADQLRRTGGARGVGFGTRALRHRMAERRQDA